MGDKTGIVKLIELNGVILAKILVNILRECVFYYENLVIIQFYLIKFELCLIIKGFLNLMF